MTNSKRRLIQNSITNRSKPIANWVVVITTLNQTLKEASPNIMIYSTKWIIDQHFMKTIENLIFSQSPTLLCTRAVTIPTDSHCLICSVLPGSIVPSSQINLCAEVSVTLFKYFKKALCTIIPLYYIFVDFVGQHVIYKLKYIRVKYLSIAGSRSWR